MSFAGVKALDEVSFTVAQGSVTALIGPNGTGKTNMINVLSGVVAPTAGAVRFQGQVITRQTTRRQASSGIRRTFRTVHLFPGLMVRENLLVGRFHHVAAGRWWNALLPGPGDLEGRRLADLALDLLGPRAHADTVATSLPYGTQRRVEIARALMSQPAMLLDEPAAGVNDTETEHLHDDIRITSGALSVQGLSVGYGPVPVLEGVSLEVPAGRALALREEGLTILLIEQAATTAIAFPAAPPYWLADASCCRAAATNCWRAATSFVITAASPMPPEDR